MAKKKNPVDFSSLTLNNRVRRQSIRKTTGKQKPVLSAIGNDRSWGGEGQRCSENPVLSGSEVSALGGRVECSENLVISASEVSALSGKNKAENWRPYLEAFFTNEAHGGTGKPQTWVVTCGIHSTPKV